MKRLIISIAVILLTSIIVTPSSAVVEKPVAQVELAPAMSVYSRVLINPTIENQWKLVAQCETGGNWKARGPVFSGGIGIRNINWKYYGGTAFAKNAADASPQEQILVAQRIEGHGFVPDQYGVCSSW